MRQVYAICRDSSINFGRIPEGEDLVVTKKRLGGLTKGDVQFAYEGGFQPSLDLILDEVSQLQAICRIVWGTYEGGQFEFVDENLKSLKVIEVPPGSGV